MKIKCAGAAILISVAFASQAFAVLRPLFPVKPAAPFNSEVIVIGRLGAAVRKKTSNASPALGTVASARTAGYGLCHEGCLLRRLRFSKDLPRARDAASIETHAYKGRFRRALTVGRRQV